MEIIKEPAHHKMICPDCGSKEVEELTDREISTTSNIKNLKQYCCKTCKIEFIPGVLIKSDNNNQINENISQWSKSVRMSEGNNNGRSWTKEKIEYIIIKKKV